MGPYFPIFVDVRQRPILVIGGGAVGLEKTTVLLRAEASNVTVISPQLAEGLQAQADAGHITHIARAYAEGDMAGFEMVFIATADRSANATIRAEGGAAASGSTPPTIPPTATTSCPPSCGRARLRSPSPPAAAAPPWRAACGRS